MDLPYKIARQFKETEWYTNKGGGGEGGRVCLLKFTSSLPCSVELEPFLCIRTINNSIYCIFSTPYKIYF